ncbi:mechanosensitive ion channel family protein [Altererythrobacter ishigakiensis]|nr:mechanosensitive ion channel domain-containing protein [Altererythrobacter ishigakiensis]
MMSLSRLARIAGAVMAGALFLQSGDALAQAASAPSDLSGIAEIIRWSGVFASILWIAGAWLILRVAGRFVEAFGGEFSSRRLTLQKVYTVLQFVIYVVSTIAVIFMSFRIDDTTMALVGGSLAVAVGFATKDLVASYIAGLIIMLDHPFQVGDRVKFAGEYGDIVAIGLRSVRMRTLDDNIVTIPNSKFLTDITASGNSGQLDMQVVIDFLIEPSQDAEEARTIVTEAALSSQFIFLPKPVVVLVSQWQDGLLIAVRLRLKAYVLDTRYEKEFESDVSIRVLKAFQQRGILVPSSIVRS